MNEGANLRPLSCAGCGAALALGQGKAVRCQYCGADTPIPVEYAQLQRSQHAFAQDKRLAHDLYGEVGKPPGWLLRTLSRHSEQTSGVALGVVGFLGPSPLGLAVLVTVAYGLGYPVAALLRQAAWLAGERTNAPLSPYLVLGLAALLIAFLVGIPVVLIHKEREMAPVRRAIHASLAALLPESPGGPSRCRSCGAALDVPSGALGVPCAYCKADNLVALPEAWVNRVRSSEFRHFSRIDAALNAFRQAAQSTREQSWKLVFGFILVFPLIMLLAFVFTKLEIHF